MKPIRHILADQKGAYFLMSAIVLSVMVAFAALGVEIGRWYAVQAEMSKAIDAAAFAGAKNISNPLFPNPAALDAFAVQVAQANYPPGLLDTDTPVFVANVDADGKMTVNGTVNSLNKLTPTFETGTATTALGAVGSAKLRKAEIALILDISGSMSRGPAPINELRDGARQFVANFADYNDDHKFGLVAFASGVETQRDLATDFLTEMDDKIAALTPDNGGTNMEHGFTKAGALSWSPPQMGLPVNERTRQTAIFFSDGEATAFYGDFTYKGNLEKGIAQVYVNGGRVIDDMKKPDFLQEDYSSPYISRMPRTGNGQTSGPCGSSSVKWHIFEDSLYGFSMAQPPVSAGVEQCDIGKTYSGGEWRYGYSPLDDYVRWVAQEKTRKHAQLLKDAGIELYTIGLATTAGSADELFMKSLATDADHAKFANSEDELEGIFQEIANQLKLVLVS